MSIRKTAVAFTLAALASPLVFATSGASWVGGEAGFATHPVQSNRTSAQVQEELRAFRGNPVTADGGRSVGGEIGYVPHQHVYTVQGGKRVHGDSFGVEETRLMGAAPLSDAERRAVREQYIN